MKTFWRSLRAVAGAAAVCAVLAATTPVRAQSGPITIAATPSDSGAQVFYALDQGFFKKGGLDVKMTINSAGASVAASILGGSIDFGTIATTNLITAHTKGIAFTSAAPGSLYSSKSLTSELIVGGSSPFKSAADLNGKTIAVFGLKSISQIAVQAWLDAHGGNSASVNYIELPFAVMPAALKAGRIDAAFISEPMLSQARADGLRSIGQPYDAIGSSFLINVWACTPEFTKAHPDVVRKFAQAMAEASAWANTHHAESAVILEKWTKTKVAPKMARSVYAVDLTDAELSPVIDISAKYGLIPKAFPAAELLAQ